MFQLCPLWGCKIWTSTRPSDPSLSYGQAKPQKGRIISRNGKPSRSLHLLKAVLKEPLLWSTDKAEKIDLQTDSPCIFITAVFYETYLYPRNQSSKARLRVKWNLKKCMLSVQHTPAESPVTFTFTTFWWDRGSITLSYFALHDFCINQLILLLKHVTQLKTPHLTKHLDRPLECI